jgi:serine/threonine-protein kinase
MDEQEETPKASRAAAEATEADEVGHPEKGEHQDQIPGGRYHIVERLSTSAIGAVYKALDTVLDRPVAVKCVRLDTPLADRGPDELRERFVREARIAARLQHPNIVTIHDIVATPNRGYIIMEFIEGRTLESLITSEGRLPLSTAIKILSQLSSALDYAHGKNVVHRDVKPANILVSPDMYAWVADFGIAKSELSTNLTMAGGVLGAPDYMSPEQAKGEDVDSRSDLFSLGCILFEAAVGEKPFRSPSLTGVLLSIINDEPVFPLNWRTLGLPTELKPILHHSLEKQREKRFASGEDMMAALPGRAQRRPSPSTAMKQRWTRRLPLLPLLPVTHPRTSRWRSHRKAKRPRRKRSPKIRRRKSSPKRLRRRPPQPSSKPRQTKLRSMTGPTSQRRMPANPRLTFSRRNPRPRRLSPTSRKWKRKRKMKRQRAK